MTRGFEFRTPQMILALALMAAGAAAISIFSAAPLIIVGSNFTSIGILIGGSLFYAGVVAIVAMFKNETYLSIALLLPSMIAVAIFVYGFIAWSVRVSLSRWTGLAPDFTWVGLQQYAELLTSDLRFGIDARNTGVFTVGFILGCLVIGLALAVLLDQRLKGEAIFRGIFLFPMSISFIASGVVWAWLMSPAMGDRITGINLIFQMLHL